LCKCRSRSEPSDFFQSGGGVSTPSHLLPSSESLYRLETNPLYFIRTPDESRQIDHSKAFDYDVTWWGVRFYFSHRFIERFRGNTLLYTGTVQGVTSALFATFSYFAIRIPSWLGPIIGAIAALGAWVIMNADRGCGVYAEYHTYSYNRVYSAPC